MKNFIELPAHDSKTGLFLAFLLKGHTLWQVNWNTLTGYAGHAQRAHDLRQMNYPLREELHNSPSPKAKGDCAFYSLNRAFIDEMGKDRAEAFIGRVEKAFSHDEDVKKGLQSKPQPLTAILSGQAINSEVSND